MIQSSLLVRVVAAECSAAVVGLAMFFGHGVLSGISGRRTDARLTHARVVLQLALEDPEAGTVGSSVLVELPTGLRIALLAGIGASLAGARRQRLTAIASDLGVLSIAERRCKSRLWWRRLHGARLFTLLGGGTSCVPGLLGDPRPEVRAQAAEWVSGHPDEETVDRLVSMLVADDASTRFTVKDSLIRIGGPVTERLAGLLSTRPGQGLEAPLEVALALPDPRLLSAAVSLCHDDVAHVRALAGGLAGAVGGARALGVLVSLLGDVSPEVRSAAARALGRAGHWPASSALAGLLCDPSWDVRRQAAVALRSLGSPGSLFLRRALSCGDPSASDAARHVLDLPDSVVRTL